MWIQTIDPGPFHLFSYVTWNSSKELSFGCQSSEDCEVILLQESRLIILKLHHILNQSNADQNNVICPLNNISAGGLPICICFLFARPNCPWTDPRKSGESGLNQHSQHVVLWNLRILDEITSYMYTEHNIHAYNITIIIVNEKTYCYYRLHKTSFLSPYRMPTVRNNRSTVK